MPTMTDEKKADRGISRFRTVLQRFRLIWLAPVLAFLALSAWAFASPIGAAPDDDFHLISTWCANGGTEECQPGSDATSRTVPSAFREFTCYVQVEARSAACQEESVWKTWPGDPWETKRGNFGGEYPDVYYSFMHVFAGDDLQANALVMRVINAAIFVALGTALAVLLSQSRRRTLLWGWLVTLVPLGMFIIPSNNPSSWAIMGVGTAFLALLGWYETPGRRRWILAVLYVLGVLMAAGARGDAAVYVGGATAVAALLTVERTRAWLLRTILPVAGIIIALILFYSSTQSAVGGFGFTEAPDAIPIPTDGDEPALPLTGLALVAYNLLMLPFLWTGVWGTWALGWFDTQLPAIVPWAAAAAFIVVMFAALGRMAWRKAVAVVGMLVVLVVIPVYVLSVGGDRVGLELQPRYLLPLIVLLALVLLTDPEGRGWIRFTRLQMAAVVGALMLANFVAMHVNIRRYVTGADAQGPNLDANYEWWWTGFPVGPSFVWIFGSLAFAGLLIVLWPTLRRPSPLPVAVESRTAA